MFNSVTISLLYKIWAKIEYYYNYSLLKKIVDKINKIIDLLLSGSLFYKFLTNNDSYFENSILFSIYSYLIDKLNNFFKLSKEFIERYKKGSNIYDLIKCCIKDELSFSNTIYLTVMFFSISILIVDIINKNLNNFMLFFAMFIFSLVFLINKVNIINAIYNSYFIKIINSIFTVDEGDDKWW